MVDPSSSFFINNWRHHDITDIVKYYLCVIIIIIYANFLILSDTLLFKYFFLYVFFEGNLVSVNNFNNFTP